MVGGGTLELYPASQVARSESSSKIRAIDSLSKGGGGGKCNATVFIVLAINYFVL